MKATAMLRPAFAAFSVLLILFAPARVSGQGIPGYPEHVTEYDPREVAMLPQFCPYTQLFRDRVPGGNNREEIRRWHATMGDIFQAMHHYCWGLMYLNRAKVLARDAQARGFNYGNAVMEFDYVIERAPQDFVLLPEILTKKGEALMGGNRVARALVEFERAIELKPDYWPPYAHISDHYRSTGDVQKARHILETGLSRSPQAKGLQRRLKELDDEVVMRSGKGRPK